MSQLPKIDWDSAITVGTALIPVGQPPKRGELAQLVDDLHIAATRSVELVKDVTGLDAQSDVPELVVDRKTMLRANVKSIAALSTKYPIADTKIFDGLNQKARGAALGALLAILVPRILGQYDPYGSRPALLLNAPSIYHIGHKLDVDQKDFRLWVTLHEQTHRVQFANAEWLREYILQRINLIISDDAVNTLKPEAVIAAAKAARKNGSSASLDGLKLAKSVLSPPAAQALSEVNAAMSLLEGHADVMMDAVGTNVIATLPKIRRRFQLRRNRGGFVKILNRLLGIDAKLAQYANGAKFCRTVINKKQVSGLNQAWIKPANLPSEEELAEPAKWIARVLDEPEL